MGNPLDLKQPIPAALAAQQTVGDCYAMEIDGVHHKYELDQDLFLGRRLINRIKAEQGWFESLVRHAPSVGTFYEDNLRSLIREVLPSQLHVGTGFIFNPETKIASKQLDLIVYTDRFRSPYYKRGDFVVIAPEMAIGQCEVKKNLRISDIKQTVAQTFMSYFGKHPYEPSRVHRICMFGYSSQSSDEKIFSSLQSIIEECAGVFRTETGGGKKVLLEARHLVLPSVYFLDRSSYFESTISSSYGSKISRIKLTNFVSSLDSGVNDFFVNILTNNAEDHWARDFSSLPLRNYVRDETLGSELIILQHIPMLSLLNHFEGEADQIRRFNIRGKKAF